MAVNTNDATRAQAWVALALWGLSAPVLARLLREFGTPEAVLAASPTGLAPFVPKTTLARLQSPDAERLAITRDWLTGEGHQLVTWDDPDYPSALLELNDAPPVFFFVGQRELLSRPALAIVGSRNATPQGLDNARAFAAALSQAGVTIISGMALGIDAAAHEGGLTGVGSSLAVIGTGPDRVYPARNHALAHKLAGKGGILSEFLPGTPPLPANFPRRNRIISGLAQGVLVIEATLSSGSLITARLAGEQGRDVFAVPGSIHSPFSKGCHKLIRDGAKLVETAQDILDELPALRQASSSMKQTPSGAAAKNGETAGDKIAGDKTASDENAGDTTATGLLAALGHDPVDLDTLVARTGSSADALQAELIMLELQSRVAALPGGRWQVR
ncbi:MAG: DNA-processing protein DprA [Burkholderiales bacterium]|jgi:DNA processing protein|nr:DNA-processing protein DprA [Burkholderiales bacterium]